MRTSLTLGLLAASQVAALIAFQLVVLAALGVGAASDAFVAAQAVPAVLTGVLAMSLQSVWQPRLAVASNDARAWRAAHRCAHAQALMAFVVAGGALLACAMFWVPLLYAGFDAELRRAVLGMTPWLLLAAVLQGAAAILTSAERGRDRFVPAESAVLAVTLLATALAWPVVQAFGVEAAAALLFGRAAVLWLVMLLLVGGSRPDWRAAWGERAVWRQLRPLIAGSGVYKTAPLVDRFWSSMAPIGGVTLLGLAQSAMGAVAGVLERSLCAPALPRIARCVAAGDATGVRGLYRRAVLAVGVATACVALLFIAVQPAWAVAMHALLSLDAERAATLWWLCILLLGFLFVAAAGTAVVGVFYALGDTRTPALIGLTGFVIGVAAKSAGFLMLGIHGLVLATSLYYIGNLVALVVSVERRIESLRAAGHH